MFQGIYPGFQDPDSGFQDPDSGFQDPDSGSGSGLRILGSGFWISGSGSRISSWIPDPGVKKLWTPDPDSKHCTDVFRTHCLHSIHTACIQDKLSVTRTYRLCTYGFIDTGANHKVLISPNFCKYLKFPFHTVLGINLQSF
jgi:hypothetical protein